MIRDESQSAGLRTGNPGAIALVIMVLIGSLGTSASAEPGRERGAAERALETYLDRLRLAESGGRADARNRLSTALGHYQFLEQTFQAVVARHFAAEVQALRPAQVLALRADPAFARRAAAAFTRDNADHLSGEGMTASFTNLRLAHLLGPAGAVRLLKAPPQTRVTYWVSAAALRANPFLATLTVENLIARAKREIETDGTVAARPTRSGEAGRPIVQKPAVTVRCDLGLASCRKWLALANRRLRS
jgi:hypothetical protein